MSQIPTRRVVSQSAIARQAGVARTTVSLALRGGEGLNPETISRVMKAAELLGYRPNNLVNAIRSGRTRMIGVMVPPYDSFWSDVLHGIHEMQFHTRSAADRLGEAGPPVSRPRLGGRPGKMEDFPMPQGQQMGRDCLGS